LGCKYGNRRGLIMKEIVLCKKASAFEAVTAVAVKLREYSF